MEYRLQFEHLMCTAFDCKRCDFSFVNADYYNSMSRDSEVKTAVVCALLALSQKRPDAKEQLRAWAKSLDEQESLDWGYLNNILEKLYEAKLVL